MMPFGMSMGAAGHNLFQQHHGSGALQRTQQSQQLKHLRTLTTAAAAATAGVAGMHLYRTGKLPQLPQRSKAAQAAQPLLQIPRELAEVICGAVGEIVQVAVLYPLDTIKVRCQAGGLPVSAVLKQLGSSGGPQSVLRQLYAGVVSASLASVVVGSLYYFTFCAAKRAATKMVAKAEQKQDGSGTTAAAAAAAGLSIVTSGTSSSTNSSSAAGTPRQFPHSNGLDYHGFDPVFAAICSDDKAVAAATAAALHQPQSSQPAATSGSTASATSGSNSSSQPELSSNGKLQANILAACAAAVVGALVEAPVELFKHRAQAGQIKGAMVQHVVSALKQHGPAALYGSFFIPFLFKSLPFDIGELMTYSSLNDWRAAQLQSRAAGATPSRPTGLSSETFAAVPAPAVAISSVVSDLQQSQQQQQQQELQLQPQSMPALASLTTASLKSSSSSSVNSSFSSPGELVSNMPDHVWDMTVGAAAGAAAVLISMPPDCIKTVMETGGGVQPAPGGGPLRSAGAFVGTGKQLVKQHGPSGLFMGVTPRLIESVPSTMLYWLAVEGCRRMLEPYVAPEKAAVSTN